MQMYTVGDKIIYGENGVCTVEKIAPLEMSGASEKLYYYLTPYTGSGTYFAPVDSAAYMRPVMSRAEATMKRAKDILHGELAVALELELDEVEQYIAERIGEQ